MKMINPIEIDFLPDNYVLPPLVQALTDAFHLPHIVGPTSVGALEASSKKPDGTAWFGTGNSTSHFLHLFDHTSGIEFGLQDHYRTGDYVNPVNGVATMDAGYQNGTHNEQGTNLSRSQASFDPSFNFGSGQPTDGKFVLDVNGHDYTLGHTGSGATAQWFLANAAHTPVFGLTLSPDGHVLQDSINFGFGEFAYLAHNSANSGDLAPQDIHITLTEMVGTVGVAQVSETIHLV